MYRTRIAMAITRSKRVASEPIHKSKQPKVELDEEAVPVLEPPKTPVAKKKQNDDKPKDMWRETHAKPIDRSLLMPDFVKGLDHLLAVDSSLKAIVDISSFTHFEMGTIQSQKDQSSFQYLVRSIIGQQVSGAAAASILKKFRAVFSTNEESFPTPDQVLEASNESLRGAGLSMRKAEYVKGISEAYKNGTLSDDKLKHADDDDIVDMLVALKGVGPWTADMFLLFFLRRMDTFSIGDLGVQRGVSNYIKHRPWLQTELKGDLTLALDGLHSPGKSTKSQSRKPAKAAKSNSSKASKWKVPEVDEMLYIANKFKPYRSVFQVVMWRLSDTNLEVLAKD